MLDDFDNKEQSKKVEVVVSPGREGYDEISLIRVFSNMATKKKIYLRLLAILLILGLALPLVLANLNRKESDAQAVLTLKYSNPEAVSFSSYVLQDALDNTATSEKISISQLESNIKIERLLSVESRQRQEILEAQIKANASTVSQAANIVLKYDNTYIVTLKNGFGGTYLRSIEIRDLLNNIIHSYNSYLHESKTFFSLPVVDLSALDLNNLDYLDSLDTLDSYLKTLKKYCDDNVKRYPDYRGATNKLSFQDLSDAIAVLRSIDINHLYSYILQSGVSKDRDETLNRYNYNLRNATMQLQSVNSRIDDYKRIIDSYENDAISLFGGDGQDIQIAYVTSDYYNQLVNDQAALLDEKAALEQQIEKIQDILKVFEEGGSAADSQAIQEEYNRVYSDAEAIQDIVLKFAEEALNSDNIRNSYLTYTTAQTNSYNVLSKANIKKSIIGGVAGAAFACGLWFVVCFYDEMKKGGKKNEEA